MIPAGAAGAPQVALREVTRRFPSVVAAAGVSFSVRAGEVHVLLGENGAGKSTLVAMLAGMQRPDAGAIEIAGRATRIAGPGHALALGIGTVFQHRLLVPTLTVVENLLLGGAWWRRPRRAAVARRLAETCARLGIDLGPDRLAGQLSLAQQQQVEIVRALWRGGRVVVLDEPTALLSAGDIGKLGRVLRGLAANGLGVVFITHKLDEAVDCGDRVTVLRQGRVAGELGPEALRGARGRDVADRLIGLMFGYPDAAAERPPPRVVGPTALAVRGMTLANPGGSPALEDIGFDVAEGEIFGVAGIDGNGQTHLAEALAGQSRASGTISLHGRPLAGLDVAARQLAGVRYLTADRLGEGIVGGFSVAINLLLKQIGERPCWRFGLTRPRAIELHAADLVRRFDIRTPDTATPADRLSGGNIQKLVLARELRRGARLVILNQPTHGLDLRGAAATRVRIAAAATAGAAVVLISNDFDEVLDLADRIGVLVGGRLVGTVAAGPDARLRVARLMAGLADA